MIVIITACADYFIYIPHMLLLSLCCYFLCLFFFYNDFTFKQATNINMADHELFYQERVLKITDELQELNIVDGSELDLQGTLKLQEPRGGNHEM